MKSRLSLPGIAAGVALAFATTGANAQGDGALAGPFSWTGFYFGAAAGYGTGTTEVTNNAGAAGDFDTSIRGGQGTLSLGYDYRAGPKFVVGVLADMPLANSTARLLVRRLRLISSGQSVCA